jgi:hypothetical protein
MRRASLSRPGTLLGLITVSCFIGCSTSGGALRTGAEPEPMISAQAAFERLKSLAGTWEGRIGRDTAPARVSIFVTAKGTAVVERLVIQDPVEMVSVYHLDRALGLVMQHYCAAGNQPRMILAMSTRTGVLNFAFGGGSGVEAARDLHMHSRRLIITGADQMEMVWETYSEGRAISIDTMSLKRRS